MSELPPPSREPFAVQAARFSLYVPIVIVVLNVVLSGTFNRPNESVSNADMNRLAMLIVGIMSQLGLIAGFILGIVALFGIRRHGSKGILWRAITGILLNGFFIAASVLILFVLRRR